MSSVADIGVIGGSGFYQFLDQAEEVKVDTPFGPPSDPITVGEVNGRRVAFVPRHGRDHRFPPHRIPYRANLWALRSLGVRQVIAPSAVGSLTPDFGPGTLAVPDQLVDRTRSRDNTFYDRNAIHVSFADPYCATGRERAAPGPGCSRCSRPTCRACATWWPGSSPRFRPISPTTPARTPWTGCASP